MLCEHSVRFLAFGLDDSGALRCQSNSSYISLFKIIQHPNRTLKLSPVDVL